LDEVAPNNPVSLGRIDSHPVGVKSFIIEMCGLTKVTKDPSGEPTRIIKETATRLKKSDSTSINAGGGEETD